MIDEHLDFEDDQTTDLGSCCICGVVGATVVNVLTLPQKAPLPGRGWGCVVCMLPSDGAVAVICTPCLETFGEGGQDIVGKLVEACRGWPGVDGRVPIGELGGEHRHNETVHAMADAADRARGALIEIDDLDDGRVRECDDKEECSAASGGTAHRACAHCGAETGCAPVLLFRERRPDEQRVDDVEMFAVCDACLTRLYRTGTSTRGRR